MVVVVVVAAALFPQARFLGEGQLYPDAQRSTALEGVPLNGYFLPSVG
jgi:hypothetical protein